MSIVVRIGAWSIEVRVPYHYLDVSLTITDCFRISMVKIHENRVDST